MSPEESSYAGFSRRSFVQAASAAVAAAVVQSPQTPAKVMPPHRVRLETDHAPAPSTKPAADSEIVRISQTIATASGSPLGGIGTGYVDIRPDGCFYDWLIFNAGAWAGQLPAGQSGQPPMGPQSLQFMLRTANGNPRDTQMRRLYLRPHENNLYSLGYVQDVQAIEYDAWFPMTSLRYVDDSLPVRISAEAFSPFFPGNARTSGTPGFNFTFTLDNRSHSPVTVSLLSLLDNPLAAGRPQRRLHNAIQHMPGGANLLMRTDAGGEDKTTIGSLCLSLHSDQTDPTRRCSWICGTFPQYTAAGPFNWNTPRLNWMLVDLLQQFFNTGSLPNSSAEQDPSQTFTLIDAQIRQLTQSEADHWLAVLSRDALLGRIISDARITGPKTMATLAGKREILLEIANNLTRLAGVDRSHSTWGSGALCAELELPPGAKKEIRFTLAWHFPHHFSKYGRDMGHNYDNWFADAQQVGEFMVGNYAQHRHHTRSFARTLAATSLGAPMAFAWSSHLGTAVTNTWWDKAGNYSIWEGLGCCGQSTMDVEFDASFPIVALFPGLKLGQMRHMLQFQKPNGQVPHNYDGDFHHIDQSGWGRVDMNPQFVMMVLRDYLWTADKTYLDFMWPHVKKAMAFTASLIHDNDALPNTDCGFQTYDQWGLRGSPAYICSLWIGALAAAAKIAGYAGDAGQAATWQNLRQKAVASFDRLLFNGQYYSLWVDGDKRDEMCMSDQISGIWFSHLMGLSTGISKEHLVSALASIWKYNFSGATGLRNASAPRGGKSLLVLENLQAGGVWSGIEFAFASFLMDHGRYDDGQRLVNAVHERYLRAGMPWNHVECGDHYSRPMSSWATLLAATGFKPDMPNESLMISPQIPGDFHAPWVMTSGFGTIRRIGQRLELSCASGSIGFRQLQLQGTFRTATLDHKPTSITLKRDSNLTQIMFNSPLTLKAGHVLTME